MEIPDQSGLSYYEKFAVSGNFSERRTVHFISLGCPKNRVDTEAMLGLLEGRGFSYVSHPSMAKVVVVNTCGFVKPAVSESLCELRRFAKLKKRCRFRLIAAGCLVQRMGEELRHRIPEIDSLIGVHGCRHLPQAVAKDILCLPSRARNFPLGYYRDRRLTTGPGWAYLRIADGCDNRCSYCLIPSIRGPHRSRRLEEIVAEAEHLASLGVVEINLVSQDTTQYGVDIYGRRCLGRLLGKLDRVPGIKWIRLLYTHPAHFNERLIGEMSQSERLVRYLDIPLQHISNRILKSMGRKTDRKRIETLIDRLRSAMPGLVLRTTMMVGYPGESDAEFNELMEFVEEIRFDRLGAFIYSSEPETRAAIMPQQLPYKKKLERWHLLMDRQRKISISLQKERIGSMLTVLIEGDLRKTGRSGSIFSYLGRSHAEAPEVDGKVYVNSSTRLHPGQLVKILVDRAYEYDLSGKMIEVVS